MRQRFLAPATESILLDGEGFLADPTVPTHEWLLGKLVKPEDLVNVSIWILLGEPGSGKSSVFEEHEAWLRAQPPIRDGGEIWRFDLKPYASEQRLLRDLFNSPRFLSWLNGTGDLHLLLDSFDEGQFRIDSLSGLLKTELEQLPAEARSRLKLRIACRSGVWLPSYTQALEAIWPSEQTRTYQLAPLRRSDVEQEVQAMGLDAASFISPLVERRMVPLAIRPITLQLLLNLFKRGELFQQEHTPITRVEIYSQGCLYLCQEPDAERNTAARRAAGLSPQRRLQIAEWIAAVMVFGNRAAIWTGSGAADSTDELSVMELCTDQPLPGQANPITETDLRAVLEGSALFALRGAGHTVWIHQSYAEFLAAQWLVKQQLSEEAILEFIRHPDSPEYLLPALQETASCLAELRPELVAVFLREYPLILLQNEAGTRTAEQRRQLVDSILSLYEQERRAIVSGDLGQYRRLSHPELAQQLAPVIKDEEKAAPLRCVAIQVALDAGCGELASLLADVALNPTDAFDVREQAARALVSVGNEQEKSRLVPLALGQCGMDPEDQLRGYALFAVWPSHLSPPQLFSALIPPKRPNLIGAYQSFVHRLSGRIGLDLVPDGLVWAAELPAWRQLPLGVSHLARVIFRLAMANIDVPVVARALVHAVARRLGQGKDPFAEPSSMGHDGLTIHARRTLVGLMTQSQETSDAMLSRLVTENFVQKEDIEWLLGKLDLSTPPAEQERWLKLVSWYALRILQAPYDDRILDAAARHPELQKTEPLGPHLLVELGSQEAQNQKASYEAMLAWSQEQAKKEAELPQQKATSPSSNIITCLDHIESDHVSAWSRLIHYMCFDEQGKKRGEYFNAVLIQLPGWIQSPVDVRHRILQAARRYIMEEIPSVPPIEWRVKGAFRPSASSLAGYPAFRLILDEEPPWIEALPKEAWARWAWSLVCYRDNSSSEQNQRLFTHLYQAAPDSLIEGVVNQIRDEDQIDSWPGDLGFLTRCWDDRLGQVFLALAKDSSFSTQTFSGLLRALLRRNAAQAKEYALSVLEEPIPKSGKERERLLATAVQLLTAVFPPEWPVIFGLITKDPQLGAELFQMGNWDRRSSWHDQLDEAALAELFTWLWTHKDLFPRREDEEDEDDSEPLRMRTITPEESLEQFRDGVLNRLIQRGTKESMRALEQLCHCFSAEDKFRIAIELGRDQYLSKSSQSHRRTPQQLISMLGRKEAMERSLVKRAKPSSLSGARLLEIEHRRALLIGVNSYQDPNFVRLKYCENDVYYLSKVFQSAQYEIIKMYNNATEERCRPTRNAVESMIKNTCESARPEELILIHFSGHGKMINGRPVLVLKDSYNNTLETTGLLVDWILEQLRKSKAQQKILLLDACHVGLELGRASAEEVEFVRHVYDSAIGTAIISASTAQQVAGEDRERQMGIFSYYLLKGLQGAAMHAQYDFVTVDGIKNYVLKETRAWSLSKGLSLQEPTFQIEGMGDVIIIDRRKKPPILLKNKNAPGLQTICLVIVLIMILVTILIWLSLRSG